MRIITQYLLIKYLKNFLIVLFSLEIFFVGMDLLQNMKSLPDSANLQLLYVLYNSFFTLTITLPLSLVFAWVITIAMLVKSNEIVAMLSLGAKVKQLYRPIINLSVIVLILLIGSQATPLAYSYEQKSKILDGEYFVDKKEDIFVKYNDYFVYFKKLYPIEKYAENIHIYRLKDNDIIESIVARKAYFQNNRWYVVDAKIMKKPQEIDWDNTKLEITHEKFLHTLEGFKPKILDNVYEAKSAFSITDAVSAIVLLKSQDINTDKIRAALYYQVVGTFFIIPLIGLIFAYTTVNARSFNMGIFITFSIFGTLLIWGVFFLLQRFSQGGVFSPEFSLLLPLVLWYIVAYIIFKRKSKQLV